MGDATHQSFSSAADAPDTASGRSGTVFDIQRYAIHDGPGIRTTVFLKGCPLDCWWCHNPESQSARPQVIRIEGRCVRCGECVTVCPNAGADGEADAVAAECTACGACVAVCPTGARRLAGKRMTVEEVLAEVLKDRVFYEDSGGGATFSGGEPLLQPQFLTGLLNACRGAGLHTVLDTCGFAPWDDLAAVAPLTDLFLYDVKGVDEQEHTQHTGVSSGLILDNLRALGGIHGHIWLRVPLLPGINDDEGQLEAVARLAASMPAVRRVNLLPYHATGVHKFRQVGKAYRLEGLSPPSAERLADAAAIFRAHGLDVRVGG